jgi:RNA polymerase sigma-70 factor, ECF subfamily
MMPVVRRFMSPSEPPDPLLPAAGEVLISDEPTMELVIRARDGDRSAVEALLQRSLPRLKRWAHGRLPVAARGMLDTGDLVQDAAMHAMRRLDTFEPRHVGAMQAYLRTSVLNHIRDEVRRVVRHPAAVELTDDHDAEATSPLELAIESESYARYRKAMEMLTARDREMIVARIEAQWSLQQIAERFDLSTVDAARMAVLRAVRKLRAKMDENN